MLATARAQLFRVAGQATRQSTRSLAARTTWLGDDFTDSPDGKLSEGTKNLGSVGYKKTQEVHNDAQPAFKKTFSRADEDSAVGETRAKAVKDKLKKNAEAPAENIRVEGAGTGPLGYANQSGRPIQGKKTTITFTRNISTSVDDRTVKDSSVDLGQAASIDAVGECPDANKNPAETAKKERVTREALNKIPGEKGGLAGTAGGVAEKIKEGAKETVEGAKHAAEKVKEKGEEVLDKAKKWVGAKVEDK